MSRVTRMRDIAWDYVKPGQCMFIETMNSVYHLTREYDSSLRFRGDGGDFLLAPQRVAPIGAVTAHMVRWQRVEVGYPFMLVRCVDGMRIVTSPVQRIEVHEGTHGLYQSRTARQPVVCEVTHGPR